MNDVSCFRIVWQSKVQKLSILLTNGPYDFQKWYRSGKVAKNRFTQIYNIFEETIDFKIKSIQKIMYL